MTTRPLFWKRLSEPRPGLGLLVFAFSLSVAGLFAILDGGFGDRSWALVAGVAFGVALQRGELSLVRAWRDLLQLKDAGQLLGFLAALAMAATLTLGTLGALGLEAPEHARIGPVHWLLPVAGFLFGVASVIARGGVMVHMRRLAEGSLIALPAMLATFAGFTAGVALWPWTWDLAVSGAPGFWLPEVTGYFGALAFQIAAIVLMAAALWRFRPKGETAGSFRDRLLVSPWPAWAAGALLGALVAVSYAAGEPLGLIAECATLARVLATAIGLAPAELPGLSEGVGGIAVPLEAFGLNQHVVILAGFIAGAFAAALSSGRFAIAGFTLREGAAMLVGGFLLGLSAMTALGAITGEAIAGVAIGAASGWIFLATASLGIVVGLTFEPRIEMTAP
ncbi:YeeE/YedE thiosulfate transporter family protein [Chenggangzhangella methanolivorans]|uniref:YeeE/YedE family protein n=1 Tax=Chenggangzhangella methanolivorans TaxID=1437009 RepID=A0A9E6UPG4_9HYPH|nr:YeeE/YedE thiosulfate transporter family protein [Chenggangzhangella methanolivorans]QZN99719.1 YeeE/YedE family protein [Chenggangzhangella methanolivorans]